MLRWLVIALVVANAVYYAGTHGHLAGLDAQGRAAAQGAGELR